MKNRARPWLIAVATLCALACGDRGATRGRGRSAESAYLEGVWEARLRLERPPVLATDAADPPREAHGQFAFVRNDSRRERYPTIGVPAFYGTYEVNFAPFGFSQEVRGVLPSAVAKVLGGDSVMIVLDPTNAETTVILRGAIISDSLSGTWTVSSRRAGGGGTWSMRRVGHTQASP